MSQITVLNGPERRRRWGEDDRVRILEAAFAPGATVTEVARRLDVATSLIYKWRVTMLAQSAPPSLVPTVVVDEVPETPASGPAPRGSPDDYGKPGADQNSRGRPPHRFSRTPAITSKAKRPSSTGARTRPALLVFIVDRAPALRRPLRDRQSRRRNIDPCDPLISKSAVFRE